MRMLTPLPRILAFVAIGIAAAASCFYGFQGGFGGGGGMYDRVLFLLGLPWILVPWPRLPGGPDYVWLIVFPLISNLILAGMLRSLLRRLENRGRNSR